MGSLLTVILQDCVSYKVTQLEPTLELEEITIATSIRFQLSVGEAVLIPHAGAKCGSSYIDQNFKRWLNRIIGDRHYRVLDPRSAGQQIGAHTMEGRHMRQVVKRFDEKKRLFSNKANEIHLDLPNPLNTLNITGRITQGDLRITQYVPHRLY